MTTNTTHNGIDKIDFKAFYTDARIQKNRRFKLLCLSNPIGWVVGLLYMINELFKSIILSLGRDILFGRKNTRVMRDEELLNQLTAEMKGQELRLLTPNGHILEALYVKAEGTVTVDKPKTMLLFLGSGVPFEHYACPLVNAYRMNGFNVLCMNYTGFGKSQGLPNQINTELTAETAYQYIQKNDPDSAIYAHGYSIGSYPAAHLAKTYGLKKVVIDRGFSKLSNVVKDEAIKLYGKCVGYLLKGLSNYVCPLNTVKNIKNVSSDILWARASKDERMLAYHTDLVRKEVPQATIIDFPGSHRHSYESVWFENNADFWNWMNKPVTA